MNPNVFRSSTSNLSNNVADPSTVTVRIENCSTSHFKVDDVLSASTKIDEKQREIIRQINTNEHRRTLKQTKSENARDIDNEQKQNFSISAREKHRHFREQQIVSVPPSNFESFSKERRSQSMVRQFSISPGSSPTVPLVFLTDDVLLGSIRALQNERQLCKLSVEYLIDATNMRPDELARKANLGAPLPCHCGQTHSRCTLTLEFDPAYLPSTSIVDPNYFPPSLSRETTRNPLEQLFSAVNRFILKAQQENKRILIYGFEMSNNSPLAVIAIQYLMINNERLSLSEATHRVHRLFPVLPFHHRNHPIMEKRFQDYLKQLDKKSFPRNFIVNSISLDGSSSSGPSTFNEYRSSARDSSWDSPETTTTNIPRNSLSSATPFDQFNVNSRSATRSNWDI